MGLPTSYRRSRVAHSSTLLRRPRLAGRRLSLEALEDRRLLAGDLAMVDLGLATTPVYDKTAVIGDKLCFPDIDSQLGLELKILNTTTDVATVVDVNPGLGDSYPGRYGGFFAMGTKLFFPAYDPVFGFELRWIDTALTTPTVHTVDINSGTGDSMPGYYGRYTTVGTKLYFTATDPSNGYELRWIDTAEAAPAIHTISVEDGAASSNAGEYGGFVAMGTKLYFTATNWATDCELRWIDTTAESPSVNTIDLFPGRGGSYAGQYSGFTKVGTKLYFGGNSQWKGNELLWIDTETAPSTINFLDIDSNGSSRPGEYGAFQLVGTKLYFGASDTTNGYELRWVDTAATSPVVKTLDIRAGSNGSFVGQVGGLVAVGTKLYFDAMQDANGFELRWIDTTVAAPTLNTLDVYGGVTSSRAGTYGFASYGNRLFFAADDPSSGFELRWIDSSQVAPTVQTLDIYGGTRTSTVGGYGNFVAVGSRLYFTAQSSATDYPLWWVDMAAETPTANAVNINRSLNGVASFIPVGTRLYCAGSGLLQCVDTASPWPYFTAVDLGIHGLDSIDVVAMFGTKLFFLARDAQVGQELRWIDISQAHPTLNTLDFNPGAGNFNPTYLTAVGEKLFFVATDATYGNELRWIDTSLETPTLNTIDICSGIGGSNPGTYGGFRAVGTKLYFTAYDTALGYELRWLDTTLPTPTANSLDICSGVESSNAGRDAGLWATGNTLYFSAFDTTMGYELRWIDTTEDFPVLNSLDINLGSGDSGPGPFIAVGTKLYFCAREPMCGNELHWIDMAASTPTVATIDVNSGPADSAAGYTGFLAIGTKLYFAAVDSTLGSELRWIDTSDAAPMVSSLDIYPGTTYSTPGNFVSVGTRLYFTATDPAFPSELRWIDSTSPSPVLHTLDLYSGGTGSSPSQFVKIGTRLFFTAFKVTSGRALFVLETNPTRDVAIDFGAAGLWSWQNDTTWQRIHAYNPATVVTGDLDGNGVSDLIVDFGAGPGLGVWIYYNNSTWQSLHPYTTTRLLTADLNGDGRDEVVANFVGASGTWAFNPASSTWRKLTDTPMENLLAADLDGNGQEELVGDFGAGGMRVYWNDSSWQWLHSANPVSMTAGYLDANGQADLVVNFGPGEGLWTYSNNTTWTQLHPYAPALMTTGDLNGDGRDEVLVDFGAGIGLWEYYPLNAAWRLLTPVRSSQLLTADLDGNGKQELIADLPDHALYIFGNDTSWQYFHSYHPDGMAAGQLDALGGGSDAVAGSAARGSVSSYDRALLEVLAQDGLRQTAALESLASWDADGGTKSKRTTPRVL